MTANALKIHWSGKEEFIPFDFENIESNRGIIQTLENWYKKKPDRWVKYLASAEISRSGAAVIFKLTYKKSEQPDTYAKKNATWGATTSTWDEQLSTWSARWDDDSAPENNGVADVEVSQMPEITPSQVRQGVQLIPQNKMPLTQFLLSLGCPLRLGFYWSAKSEDDKRIIFTIWDDRIEDGRYMILPYDADWGSLPGAHEVRRHLPLATQGGDVEVFGVLCHAKDPEARTRKRAYYDEQSLLVLEIGVDGKAVFAKIKGEVEVTRARKERILDDGVPRKDALWDLDPPPPGADTPERHTTTTSSSSRDPMVRDFVLKRAQGRCEYCGGLGFEMTKGWRYLEAHHVVALASSGADTVQNVIALCASDHREAHYGVRKEQMNKEMLLKLNSIYER
jgi:5-methylcytosine-specific restriction protein A